MLPRFFSRAFTTKAVEQLAKRLNVPAYHRYIPSSLFKPKQVNVFKPVSAKHNQVEEIDFVKEAIQIRARHG